MVRRLMALVCCALVVSAAASGTEAPRARASGATNTPIARAADPSGGRGEAEKSQDETLREGTEQRAGRLRELLLDEIRDLLKAKQ